jgi:hypothetical protein
LRARRMERRRCSPAEEEPLPDDDSAGSRSRARRPAPLLRMLAGAAPPRPREEAGPAALHPSVRESEETTPSGAGEKKGRGRRKEEERDRWGPMGRGRK